MFNKTDNVNLITEDEAKLKWCPNVQGDGVTPAVKATNRRVGGLDCIASNCMGWVWNKNKTHKGWRVEHA